MFKGEAQLVVEIAVLGALPGHAGAPHQPVDMLAELPRHLRVVHGGLAGSQVTGGADHGLQALVVARVGGIQAVVASHRLAAGLGLDPLELFLVLEDADDLQQGLRVVACLVHVLGPQPVGLQLVFATVAAHQLSAVHAGSIRQVAAAGEDIGGGRHDLVGDAGSLLARGVAGGDVADLMGQDPRQLGLVVQVGQQAPVDVDEAPGGGEGVDVGAVDHGEGEGQLRPVAVLDQLLAHAVHIGLQLGVVVTAPLFHDLLVHLLADGDLPALGHDYPVGAAGGRVAGAAAQQGRRQRRADQTHQPPELDHPSRLPTGCWTGTAAAGRRCRRRRCPARGR